MRARWRPLLAATLVGLTMTPVFVASPATAGPAMLYERRVVTVVERIDGPMHRVLHAQCARDEVATGGGFDVRGTADPSAYTVNGSNPLNNGWVAQILVEGGFGHVDFAVHVGGLARRWLRGGQHQPEQLPRLPDCPGQHGVVGDGNPLQRKPAAVPDRLGGRRMPHGRGLTPAQAGPRRSPNAPSG